MRLSSRAEAIAESATLRLSARLAQLHGRSGAYISLLEGEPDLPTPPPIEAATIKALRQGKTRYSQSSGLPELKSLLAKRLTARCGIAVVPENIVVANGAKQALFDALQTICSIGDEVIIPRPYWVTFPESVRLAGGRPVFVDTSAHQLDVDAVARAVSRRTRAVIINSPNNPTGAVYPESTLRRLARLATRRRLYVISDEAYEDQVYDGLVHASIAPFLGLERSIILKTFSKSYSMTGYRVGCLIAGEKVAFAAGRIHGHVTGNVCTFAQYGAIAALRITPAALEARRKAFEQKRDLAYGLAGRLFDCIKPRGGFFVFADARRHLGGGQRDSDLAERLLAEAKVAVLPGSACGMPGFLRMSFTQPAPILREAFRRLEAALRR